MSNFLESNDSDGLPYIQWGSDAVQWSKKDIDGKADFQFTNAIFDIENLLVGWIKIDVGVYDSVLEDWKKTPIQRPEEKKTITLKDGGTKEVYAYNKGFGVKVLFPKDFGSERLFSFSTSQKGSLESMSRLLNQYQEQAAQNQGKCPVVTFSGHEHQKMGKGSTNIPKLSITSWVDRPAEFDGGAPVGRGPR